MQERKEGQKTTSYVRQDACDFVDLPELADEKPIHHPAAVVNVLGHYLKEEEFLEVLPLVEELEKAGKPVSIKLVRDLILEQRKDKNQRDLS